MTFPVGPMAVASLRVGKAKSGSSMIYVFPVLNTGEDKGKRIIDRKFVPGSTYRP
jgi:hypothetical protein